MFVTIGQTGGVVAAWHGNRDLLVVDYWATANDDGRYVGHLKDAHLGGDGHRWHVPARELAYTVGVSFAGPVFSWGR
jgi:hypothetical protein